MPPHAPAITPVAKVACGSRRGFLLAGAGLVVLVLLAFWPVLSGGFINFDDPQYVTDNPHVLQGLTREGLSWAFTTAHTGYWHPLTWLSLMTDASLASRFPQDGRPAFFYHLTNLLIHAANALILFSLLVALTALPGRAFLAAAFFAVHPLRLESVAWVSERKDVLSACLGLLCLLAYVPYARAPSLPRYVLVALLLALSLLAKPMLVTLPCVMLLLDFWPLRRLRLGGEAVAQPDEPVACPPATLARLVLEKLPLLLMVAAVGVAAYMAQVAYGAAKSTDDYSLALRLANVPVAYASYLAKTVWPTRLAVFYPLVTRHHPAVVAGAVSLLVAITALALTRLRSRPHLAVGLLWFLGVLVPVIGVIQVGGQSMADRYTYFPGIGLAIMLFWSLPEFTRFPRPAALSLLTLFLAPLAALAVVTRTDSHLWKDSETLFAHAAEVTQGNYVAYHAVGSALSDRGDFNRAAEFFKKALEIRPDDPKILTGLGAARVDQGSVREGIDLYRRALRTTPDDPRTLNNLGVALARVGERAEALTHLTRAVELNGAYVGARINLASELVSAGRAAEAMPHLRAALQIQPRNAMALYQLGRAFAATRQLDAAIDAYRQSLAIRPKVAEVHNSMGVAYAMAGRMAEAREQFRVAVDLKPDFDDARHNLERASEGPTATPR